MSITLPDSGSKTYLCPEASGIREKKISLSFPRPARSRPVPLAPSWMFELLRARPENAVYSIFREILGESFHSAIQGPI